VERLRQALEQARQSSKLHSLLSKFFTEKTVETVEAMKVCAHEELLDNRAYLLALGQLEQDLLEYINKYDHMEAG